MPERRSLDEIESAVSSSSNKKKRSLDDIELEIGSVKKKDGTSEGSVSKSPSFGGPRYLEPLTEKLSDKPTEYTKQIAAQVQEERELKAALQKGPEDLSPEGLQTKLYNDYFKSRNIKTPEEAQATYQQAVDNGITMKTAATMAGFDYTEIINGDKVEVRVTPSEGYKKQLKEAELYVATNKKTEAEKLIAKNKYYYNQKFADSQKTEKDLAEYKKGIADTFKAKMMYGIGYDEPLSKDELKEELAYVGAYGLGAYQVAETKDTPSWLKWAVIPGDPIDYRTTEFEPEIISKKVEMFAEATSNLFAKALGKEVKSDAYVKGNELGELKRRHDLTVLTQGAYRLASDIVKKTENGFFTQTGGAFVDHFTSMSSSLQSIGTRDALLEFQSKQEKINNGTMSINDLTQDELVLLHSTKVLGDAMTQLNGDVSFWTQTGEAVGGSLGFMVEMAMTGGIGSSLGKGAAIALVKKGAPKFIAKPAAVLVSSAPRALAMPSFSAAASKKYGEGEGLTMSIVDGYLDTYTSVATEAMFGTKIGKVKDVPGVRNFFARADAAFGNVVDLKSGLTAFGQEMSEEFAEGVANGLRYEWREDKKDQGIDEYLTNWDNQAVTAASVAVMTLGGGSVNTLSKASTNLK